MDVYPHITLSLCQQCERWRHPSYRGPRIRPHSYPHRGQHQPSFLPCRDTPFFPVPIHPSLQWEALPLIPRPHVFSDYWSQLGCMPPHTSAPNPCSGYYAGDLHPPLLQCHAWYTINGELHPLHTRGDSVGLYQGSTTRHPLTNLWIGQSHPGIWVGQWDTHRSHCHVPDYDWQVPHIPPLPIHPHPPPLLTPLPHLSDVWPEI